MPTSKRKTKQVAIRLSEEEYERLKVLAHIDGCSISSYLRHQINKRAKELDEEHELVLEPRR